MNDLCPRADKIVKLTSQCAGDHGQCTNKGTFTWRTAATSQQEFVGGSEAYQAVCRAHYLQFFAQRTAAIRANLDEAYGQ